MKPYDNIDLIIADLDGTLTDGMYYTGRFDGYRGALFKAFYTRDFAAISQWVQRGYKFAIITNAKDSIIDEKLNHLPGDVQSQILVVKTQGDKRVALATLLDRIGMDIGQVAYIGDAENDLEAMRLCKLTACPSDAVSIIIEESNYICDAKGGHGAVREFIMHILEHKDKNEQF